MTVAAGPERQVRKLRAWYRFTPRDKLGWLFADEQDVVRKKRFADAYKELTGEDLDSRLAAGGLSRDYSPRINGILYAE